MNLLFTLLLVVSSATFLCFCDEVDANEVFERTELVKDTGRHEKDDIIAKSEYIIADTAANKIEDTYTEERKRCVQRNKSCNKSNECCDDHVCRCNGFGQNCRCEVTLNWFGQNTRGIPCCK